MGQCQEASEAAATARRLQSYAEALLGGGNGDEKSNDAQRYFGADPQGMVLIMRKGDAVSFTIGTAENIEMGCYKRDVPERPSLMKCYIDNRNGYIEFDGARYYSSILINRCGEYVWAVRISDILYVFDMCGKDIAEIKCNE